MAHLITGYAGNEHIKSSDQGSFNASFFGAGQFVMESGNKFAGSIVNNNTVRIADGDLLMKGRHIRIEPNTYEDMTIETGTSGTNRIDLIVMTYEKTAETGIETAYLEVIKGTAVSGTPTEPTVIDGDILSGAVKNQMPLYAVTISGVVLSSIKQKFTVCPTYKTLAEQYAKQFESACNTYLGALNILDSMDKINENTQANQLAGALSVKELYDLYISQDCKLPLGSVVFLTEKKANAGMPYGTWLIFTNSELEPVRLYTPQGDSILVYPYYRYR